MFERFTDTARRSVVLAQEICREFRHSAIGPEHLLLGVAACEGSLGCSVLLSAMPATTTLHAALTEILPPGTRSPEGHLPFSPEAKKALEMALREALALGHSYIGTEHILLGLLRDTQTSAHAVLNKVGIDPETLRQELLTAIAAPSDNTSENDRDTTGSSSLSSQRSSDRSDRPSSVLETYGRNLTQMAREGKLDPLVGRDKEVDRVMQILSRRTKSNPCLVGEPGVGKTAIVEGLAQLIATDNVPESLHNVQVYTIDMGAMVAGSRYRGDFEERMKKLVKEVTSRKDIVLFLDEIHTLVGAGAAEGSIDAANMLKPALARGEMRVVGATTFDEYRKHIEKDAALERRFQPVTVNAPSVEHATEILRGLRFGLEAHHNVVYDDDALIAAVRLSDRYIADRHLPDKAIDLVDEAGAFLRIHPETPTDVADDGRRRVTASLIEQMCAVATGVPVERVGTKDAQRLLDMEKVLAARVVGQNEAVRVLSRSIRRSRAGLGDPARPLGSFLFLGPTGVGKTEVAKALSEFMFDDDSKLLTLDMSEYQEKHTVSRLIGAPPGYVGYEEPGQLTEAVRRNPHCVVLFDEIEKAHPDIFNTLLQILEEGRVTDAKGRRVDFKNTVIILTSNLGSDKFNKQTTGFIRQTAGADSRLEADAREAVKQFFRPELLNRLDEVVVFRQLQLEQVVEIAEKFCDALASRLFGHGITLSVTQEAKELLATQGFDDRYGARPLRRCVQRLLEDPLSEQLLEGLIRAGDHVVIDATDAELRIRIGEPLLPPFSEPVAV